MQFIARGPDVPDHLLHLHENGKVVFFCGAGISAPAGLPLFSCLVEQLSDEFKRLHLSLSKEKIEKLGSDRAIHLMELKYIQDRLGVRKHVMELLTPNFDKSGVTDTHKALLTLAKHHNKIRLVTTNFDRIFEEAIKEQGLNVKRYQAPALPIANHLWNSLVYLHGLLPKPEDDASALEDLVLSSPDFGVAYIAHGWASRFVLDMFRNYTVCFIGYSVEDPPIRYITDALIANSGRLSDPSHTPEMYAFIHYSEDGEKRNQVKEEWDVRGITPILYYREDGDEYHKYLHDTLKEWSRICL
ncbi:MAG: SIR2 family protein, partial [Alphaproteobacteria bacterium]|nr:SIR2 family protein [Alphaproteobacteria bacterium]